jgi:hypothetical protein
MIGSDAKRLADLHERSYPRIEYDGEVLDNWVKEVFLLLSDHWDMDRQVFISPGDLTSVLEDVESYLGR